MSPKKAKAVKAAGASVLAVLAAYGVLTPDELDQWRGILSAGLGLYAAFRI